MAHPHSSPLKVTEPIFYGAPVAMTLTKFALSHAFGYIVGVAKGRPRVNLTNSLQQPRCSSLEEHTATRDASYPYATRDGFRQTPAASIRLMPTMSINSLPNLPTIKSREVCLY